MVAKLRVDAETALNEELPEMKPTGMSSFFLKNTPFNQVRKLWKAIILFVCVLENGVN